MLGYIYRQSSKSKTDVLPALHESIEICLSPLEKVAMKGYEGVTKDNRKYQMRFLLASYTADTPEGERLLGVKRRNKIYSPCHVCYFGQKQFFGYTQSSKCSAQATVQLDQSLQYIDRISEVDETLQ